MQLDLSDRKALFASLPHGLTIVEVGVAHGDFSEHILQAAKPRLLWLVDPWQHQDPEAVGHDPSNAEQATQDAIYAAVCKRFIDFPEVTVVRRFSIDAAECFDDGQLDCVYLDGNHLEVDKDIAAWWRTIRSGGILSGHDFTVAGDYIRVRPMVEAWAEREGLPVLVTGKNSPDVYERNYPSFLVRKP